MKQDIEEEKVVINLDSLNMKKQKKKVGFANM